MANNENLRGPWMINDTHYRLLNDRWSLGSNYAPALGNLTDVWIFGGFSTSSIERITWANDTSGASLRSRFPYTLSFTATHGNTTDAWISGGDSPGVGTASSVVSRLTFANDTAEPTVRATLSKSVDSAAASGNTTDTWILGGGYYYAISTIQPISTIQRLAHSSDVGSTSIRGTLYTPLAHLVATANEMAIWTYGGATNYLSQGQTNICRMLLANDSTIVTARSSVVTGNLTGAGATGNNTDGWVMGGGVSPIHLFPYSGIHRITYSNDTNSATLRGRLTESRNSTASSGNLTDGWVVAGHKGGIGILWTETSTVERITYATDTNQANIRSNTTKKLYRHSVSP